MMDSHQDDSLDISAEEDITWRVSSGFYTGDEIIDIAAQSMADETEINLQEAKQKVRPVVAVQWAAQLKKQQTWPNQPTISDKLTAAFRSLERNHKILARMNYTCCQTCGRAEIGADRDEDTRGFVFFHEQDMESAVEGRDLYLAFGSFTKSDKKNVGVGEVIVRSLRRAGLSVEWDEDPGKRIVVQCSEWRRRLLGDEEVEDLFDDDYDTACGSSGDERESEPEPDTQSDLYLDDDPDGVEGVDSRLSSEQPV